MQLLITLTALTVFNEIQHVHSNNNSMNASSPHTTEYTKLMSSANKVDDNPGITSLWVYKQNKNRSRTEDIEFNKVSLKEPHLLTRLAKSLTYDYDPFFSKGDFEPFERRSKPVTLVGFRRNKLISKMSVQVVPIYEILILFEKVAQDGWIDEPKGDKEVAELQSPYNKVGDNIRVE